MFVFMQNDLGEYLFIVTAVGLLRWNRYATLLHAWGYRYALGRGRLQQPNSILVVK